MTEDRDHNIWASIAGAKRKLLRIRDFAVQEEFSVEQVPFARVLAADPGGGIWLGLLNGQLGHYSAASSRRCRCNWAKRRSRA